jgi:hypothetical protein
VIQPSNAFKDRSAEPRKPSLGCCDIQRPERVVARQSNRADSISLERGGENRSPPTPYAGVTDPASGLAQQAVPCNCKRSFCGALSRAIPSHPSRRTPPANDGQWRTA